MYSPKSVVLPNTKNKNSCAGTSSSCNRVLTVVSDLVGRKRKKGVLPMAHPLHRVLLDGDDDQSRNFSSGVSATAAVTSRSFTDKGIFVLLGR